MPDVDPKTSAVIAGGGDIRPQGIMASEQPAPDAPDMGSSVSPAPATMPVAAPPPPPVVATSKNPALHNLIGSVLGGLAGTPGPSYSYDESGKLISKAAPPMSTADKIRRIASNALTGLAAGGGPQRKSGLANILGGVGEGAEAVKEREEKQDILKRSQAKENFEQEQQTKLRQYDIARLNALTYATHLENEKRQNDLNPDFAQNEGLYQAAKDSPEIGPHVREISGSQAMQEIEDDKNLHTHIFLPMGKVPVTDENGNPVRANPADETSPPKMTMRYAVIDGMRDGKIPITPEMAADIKKYGPLSSRISSVSGLNAGDTYDLRQLIPVLGEIKAAKKMELDGWAKPEYAWGKDAKGKPTPIAINPNLPVGMSGKTKSLDYMPAKLYEDQAKEKLDQAQAAKDYATAENLKEQTKLLGAGLGGDPTAMANYIPPADTTARSSADLRKYLTDNKQPVPTNFETLYSVGHYDQDPETFVRALRKGTNQMPEDVAINYIRKYINPRYSKADWKAVEKITTDFADLSPTKPGGTLLAFSTATGHLGQAWEAAELLHKWEVAHDADSFQGLRALANRLGVEAGSTPQGTYDSIITILTGEIGKVAKGGTPDIPLEADLKKNLSRNLGLPQVASNLKSYSHAMLTKAKETGTSYYSYKGHYPPNLISDDARKVYQRMGIDTSDVITGPQVTPQIQSSGNSAGSDNKPKYAPNVDVTKLHSDGKVTIGWDPQQKTWVDAFTGKVYNQTPPPGQQ